MILLFPIGGILADRINKRNIMVVLDFSTALLISFFYLLVGKMNIIPLMAITMMLLYGIQGAYQPAVKASVPVLVGSEHIMKANSIIDMINSVASMAGPVIGGLLFSIFGLSPILVLSIGCFLHRQSWRVSSIFHLRKRNHLGIYLLSGLVILKKVSILCSKSSLPCGKCL
ncbi:hypothetical protein N752_11900 [Desulforamulus aquiferis]|nr:hypothetical protein N752_11900 [Desulforamulus aquiferis]